VQRSVTSGVLCCIQLEDVARCLWRDPGDLRDPRGTYTLLKGDGPDGKLKVTEDRYVNRLAANLHRKDTTGTREKFSRDGIERLVASIRSLTTPQSQVHETLSLGETQSVVLATYFVIGTLATITDMIPITGYKEPSQPAQSE
jgi:hypothetical protein